MTAILIENLHKKYKSLMRTETHALKGVSLKVEKGHIFGILGPNGAGKTTLIRILLSIIRPTSGEAKIFDENYSKVSIKKRLSYLAENHVYPKYLTGEQVLEYFGMLSGVTGSALKKKIDETLELVNMTKWRKTKMKKYSKGMTQRIGLAQTLINDSDLLFLDEPTDGIDALGRKEIRDLLLNIKSQGKTIFLNSHLLSEVEQICDRIAIMNKGEIIREGTIDSLIHNGNVYKIGVSSQEDKVLKKIENKITKLEKQKDDIRITLEQEEQLNFVIDTLREHKISIRYIIPDHQSLEDYFIDVLQENKEGEKK